MSHVKTQIEKEFKNLDNNPIVLVEPRTDEDSFYTAMEVTDFMLKQGKTGVYVTATCPYKRLLKEMKKRNINTNNLEFIDCISRMSGVHGNGDCIYLRNPALLEEMNIHICHCR